MPVETGLWRIHDAGLSEVQRSGLSSEADLHKWIEKNPGLISTDLLLIGSEVPTPYSGRIDLLGIDSAGTVHIIELKRDKTPREVVAQSLDYASWVVSLTGEDLNELCLQYRKTDLATAYQDRFDDTLPDSLNAEHSITIVAAALDASSERIVQYLSKYDLNINVVFFRVFDDGAGKWLTRSWLIDPEKVTARSEERAERKSRGDWTGYYFVNIGVGTGRSWSDARKYGFVSAGHGARFKRFMQKLQPGDKIFGYVKGKGYVGYGVVTAPALMARDFRLSNGSRLLDQKLEGTTLSENLDDEDLAQYVVAVDWKATVDEDQAKKKPNIFSIQQVVCKIYDADTAKFLENAFAVGR